MELGAGMKPPTTISNFSRKELGATVVEGGLGTSLKYEMLHIISYMTETRSTVRRWGSSLAAVIPPEALRAEGLREGDEVILEVRRARSLEDLFGILKGRPLDAQAVKDAIRREDAE